MSLGVIFLFLFFYLEDAWQDTWLWLHTPKLDEYFNKQTEIYNTCHQQVYGFKPDDPVFLRPQNVPKPPLNDQSLCECINRSGGNCKPW